MNACRPSSSLELTERKRKTKKKKEMQFQIELHPLHALPEQATEQSVAKPPNAFAMRTIEQERVNDTFKRRKTSAEHGLPPSP